VKGSAAGRIFLDPPYYSVQCLRLSERFFILIRRKHRKAAVSVKHCCEQRKLKTKGYYCNIYFFTITLLVAENYPWHTSHTQHFKNYTVMKKSAERRKHCALAVVGGAKNFRPAADPISGGAGPPNFNQL